MLISEYLKQFSRCDGIPITLHITPHDFTKDSGRTYTKEKLRHTPWDWDLADRVVVTDTAGNEVVLKERVRYTDEHHDVYRPSYLYYD